MATWSVISFWKRDQVPLFLLVINYIKLTTVCINQPSISLVSCANSWDIKLKTWREIPYLGTMYFYFLFNLPISSHWNVLLFFCIPIKVLSSDTVVVILKMKAWHLNFIAVITAQLDRSHVCRNACNWMHTSFNKNYKVSSCTFKFNYGHFLLGKPLMLFHNWTLFKSLTAWLDRSKLIWNACH